MPKHRRPTSLGWSTEEHLRRGHELSRTVDPLIKRAYGALRGKRCHRAIEWHKKAWEQWARADEHAKSRPSTPVDWRFVDLRSLLYESWEKLNRLTLALQRGCRWAPTVEKRRR